MAEVGVVVVVVSVDCLIDDALSLDLAAESYSFSASPPVALQLGFDSRAVTRIIIGVEPRGQELPPIVIADWVDRGAPPGHKNLKPSEASYEFTTF